MQRLFNNRRRKSKRSLPLLCILGAWDQRGVMRKLNLRPYCWILTLLLLAISCNPEPQQTAGLKEDQTSSTDTSGRQLPITVTEDKILRKVPANKRISPVLVKVKPKVISFKENAKILQTDPNVEPAVISKVVRLPKVPPVIIPGQDGIPLPDTVAAQSEIMHIVTSASIPAAPPAFKESAVTSVQYLSREHGLDLECVTAMLEDKRGHIWFGCHFGDVQGVRRYDGVSFNDFPIGRVASMLEDNDGGLWFGGLSHLMFYEGDTFSIFKSEKDLGGARAMFEDKRGYLWFGTPKGLYRYAPDDGDGQGSFIHYTTQQGLSANWVGAISEDKAGNLWIGTNNGIDRYDPDLGSFTQYPTEEGLGGKGVNTILKDTRGDLWFGSRKGLYRYEPEAYGGQGSFAQYEINGSSNNIVFDLQEDSLGNLWIGHNGLSRFVPDERRTGGQFTHFTVGEGLSGQTVWDVLLDSKGNLWAGITGGVCRVHSAGFHFYSDKTGLTANTIRAQLEDSRGQIWFGTLDGGISRYDPTGRGSGPANFIQYPHKEGSLLFAIRSAMEDSRENVWIMADHALFRYNPANEWEMSTFPELNNFWAEMKLEDSHGNIWFGARKSVWRYTPDATADDGTFTKFPLEEVNARNFDILEDRWGKVWLGLGHLLLRYDPDPGKDKSRLTCYAVEESLGGKEILFIEEDSRGYIWIATEVGLSRFIPGAHQEQINLTHFKVELSNFTNKRGLRDTETKGIQEDSRGNIWIVTDEGLNRFSPNAGGSPGNITHYSDKTVFADINLGKFLEDSRGNLWFGSKANGLSHYHPDLDEDRGSFTHYTTEHGLTNNQIVSIIEDQKKQIWVITGSGINLFVPRSGESVPPRDQYQIVAFDQTNGIKHIPSYGYSRGFLDCNDQIWWTSNNGLAMLNLEQFQLPDTTVPTISLNTIEIKQHFIDYRSLSNSVNQYDLAFGEDLLESFDSVAAFYNYPLNLTVPHRLNHLTFHFSAIDWAGPRLLKYSYLLEGSDKEWSPLSPETKADFRHLPPGKYTFKVKAIGMGQSWSKVFAYSFRVLSPWYLTWWAYTTYALVVLALLYGLRAYELRRYKTFSENQQLKELNIVKNRLYTNITHEFRTPLTIILGVAEQLKGRVSEHVKTSLQLISRNGRQLLHLINEMLDLSKLESGQLKLNPELGDVISYLRYLLESFHSYADDKNIRLHFMSDLREFYMDYDAKQLMHVVVNLLSNAIKFSPEGKNVYLFVDAVPAGLSGDLTGGTKQLHRQEQIHITVKDSGIGIPEEKIPNIFDRFYQLDDSTTRVGEGTGIGLTLTRELVEMMGGRIEVKSELGVGSSFTLILPVTRVHPPAIEVTPPLSPLLAGTAPKPEIVRNVRPDQKPLMLIVEDNADLVKYLIDTFNPAYNLEIAYNGQQGLEKAVSLIPDIIITDIMMPEKDGFELCADLKANRLTSHIPVIMLTARVDTDSRLTGLRRGADAYLEKPFLPEELQTQIKALLEQRKRLQAYYLDQAGLSTAGKTEQPEQAEAVKENSFLTSVNELIDQQLSDESFNVEQLSRNLFIDPSNLYRKIKALTGISPSEYIRKFRIAQARELLLNTNSSVATVAGECGFANHNYFSKLFKRETGLSPTAFRAQRRR